MVEVKNLVFWICDRRIKVRLSRQRSKVWAGLVRLPDMCLLYD